jgi:hypothetical protein
MWYGDEKTVEQFAAEVDGMNLDRLSSTLAALRIFEEETSEWISDREMEAEENGEELVEDDDYHAEYQAFCDELVDELVVESKTSKDDFYLISIISCDKWQQIAEAMKDSDKGDLLIRTCSKL